MQVLPPPFGMYAQIGAAVASGMAVAMRERGAPVDLIEAK
jgi:hypothetical protein